MTEPEKGREPGGWELYRAISDVKTAIADMTKGFVPIAVFNLLAEDVKEARAEIEKAKSERERQIAEAKSEAAAQIVAIRTELDNAKKQRAQTWTAIGLLAAGGAIGLFYDIFTRGLGIGG